MSLVTVEVRIENGQIVPEEPEKIPPFANGLLTILPRAQETHTAEEKPKRRVKLPLIEGDGERIINPTPEELDASSWDE